MSLLFKKVKLLLGFNKTSFPKKAHFLKTALLLSFLKLYYVIISKKNIAGHFSVPIDKLALYSWKLFAPTNPLHYGEWPNNGYSPPELLLFEREFIQKTIALFKGSLKNHTGLITTGVSEANVLSISLIKEKLRKDGAKKIALLATQLAHRSVFKTSKLANLDTTIIDLNERLGMSTASLEKKIVNLRKKGFDGFIVSLTLGYKKTGTRDDYKDIVAKMENLSKKRGKLNYYIWMDAAIDGMVLPFIGKDFTPLKNQAIKTITLSLSKLAFVPYPSGLLLFNKKLLTAKENFSGGLLETKSALNGISAWAFFHGSGVSGIKKMLLESNRARELFQKEIGKTFDNRKIISPSSGITLTIILKDNELKNIRELQNIYPLRCHKEVLNINGKKKELNFVKIYFLPKTKRNIYKKMVFEINTRVRN